MLMAARRDAELAYLPQLREALGQRLSTFVSEHGQRIDFEREIAALPERGQLLLCGPVTLLDAARRAWLQAERAAADLRYETFGSSGRFAPQAFRVQVPRHQLDITVGADTSLLDALERAGVQAISDCKRGECGLCVMDVLGVVGEIDKLFSQRFDALVNSLEIGRPPRSPGGGGSGHGGGGRRPRHLH